MSGRKQLGNPVLLDAAVALYLSTGMLVCVARALHEREFPIGPGAKTTPPGPAPPAERQYPFSFWVDGLAWAWRRVQEPRGAIAAAGAMAIAAVLGGNWDPNPDLPLVATAAAVLTLVGAGLAATAASYLTTVDPERFQRCICKFVYADEAP
ncbi:MAG TPA: hypothetical protein VKM54_23075 [Myxococcota bacterium]|nr:hypothetical protein [Myxococcota bacterium]